ncbi:MAG: methenyltetrahydromethanopterin cyclohydrolase [Candidatus Thorarchaeota archaeon]
MHHVKINELARQISYKIAQNKELYDVEVQNLSNGATIFNMTNASWIGGKFLSEICMGGLGSVEFASYNLGYHYLPCVNVYTSEPIISCIASQLAGWNVKLKKEVEKEGEIKKKVIFQSLGSGPARAKSRVEKIFEEIDYTDDSECAVIVFETPKSPNEEVIDIIAKKCGVDANDISALYAPTACLTGSIQVAARIVETGIHKLHEIGFPIHVICDGFGTAPIAPIAKDDLNAMGRTNDSIIAAGLTYYTIEVEKDKEQDLFELLKRAPANTSSSYGKPFMHIFKEANYNFYDIDPGLFAPAIYTITNIKTGKTITVGQNNLNLLKQSYELE